MNLRAEISDLVRRLKGRSMFQRIVIELDGPICKCRIQDLSWAIIVVRNGETGRHSLAISCNTCQQELRVAPKEFRAAFKLEESYPDSADLVVKNGTLIDASKKFQS